MDDVKKFRPKTREPQKITKTVVDRFFYDSADSGYSALRDIEIPGFEVRAYPNRKTYSFRYRSPVTGKQRVLKIGPCSDVTAHQARQVAAKARGLVLAGEDPQDARDAARRAREAARVGDVAKRWLEEYAKPKRKSWEIDEFRLFPKDKTAPVHAFHRVSLRERAEVVEGLKRLHKALEETPAAANRLLTTFNAIFNHASREGWVSDMRNIASDIGRYEEKPREDYLRPTEFPKFLESLDKFYRNKKHWKSLVLFLLYTGCRYSEATGLLRSDVYRDAGVLIFRNTKNGTDHELPLTPSLLKVIDSAPDSKCETVWVDREPRRAFARIREHHKFVSMITPHALRHTLRTTMLVELGIPLDVVGAVTNHKYDYGAGSRYVHVSSEAVSDAIERYVAWIHSR